MDELVVSSKSELRGTDHLRDGTTGKRYTDERLAKRLAGLKREAQIFRPLAEESQKLFDAHVAKNRQHG